jgi:hypothetical protein
MQTKLTLRLDKALVEKAKSYARRTGKSVFQMVADYFACLEDQTQEADLELTNSPCSVFNGYYYNRDFQG